MHQERHGDRLAQDQNDAAWWMAPPQGWVKINLDASFHEGTRAMSAGVIIKDSMGKPLLSAWWVQKSCSSAEEAKTETCLDGVRLAAEWVRQPSIVESDCLSMIGALQQGSNSRRLGAGALWEIHAACNLLSDFRLEALRREDNVVAHDVAKCVWDSHEWVVHRFQCPNSVHSLVERRCHMGRPRSLVGRTCCHRPVLITRFHLINGFFHSQKRCARYNGVTIPKKKLPRKEKKS
jgi:hypothetical protein